MRMIKSTTRVLLGMLLLALALVGAAGCGSAEKTAEKTSSPAAATPEQAVTDFYSAKTKHGFATFHSGSQPDERVEFWFDEQGRYRLTWYYPDEDAADIEKYGPVRIHMISTDGDVVYYSRPEAQESEISFTLAEKQQWTFNGPPGWTPEAGTEEDGFTVFTYTPEKLWDVEGASQQFYLHDMKVYARDGRIQKVAMRTSSKKVPVEELTDSQFTIDEVELDVDLPKDIFELPYPVAK